MKPSTIWPLYIDFVHEHWLPDQSKPLQSIGMIWTVVRNVFSSATVQTSGGNEKILKLSTSNLAPTKREIDAVLNLMKTLKLNISVQLSAGAIAKKVLNFSEI